MYTPELKIKYFLDGLAYLLLIGNTDGIETNYKRVMNAKREIPASSCPSEIENLLYGTGCSTDYAVEEEAQFRNMLDRLDSKAEPYECRKTKRDRKCSLFVKKLQKGIPDGDWYLVDTEGRFMIGDQCYIVEDNAVQYQPVQTEYGNYYAMDKVLYAGGKFYDMNYDEVIVFQVGAET